MNYLHQAGHRRFAYLGMKAPYSTHILGVKGYRSACRALGVPEKDARCILAGMEKYPHAFLDFFAREVGEMLKLRSRPTAILCHGFDIARVVVLTATSLGIKIPRQLSVVARGTQAEGIDNIPKITVIEHDHQRMINDSLDLLLQLIGGHRIQPRSIRIEPRLVIMESTAPAPR
jgi:DNA-binding LacI/PurR family transcriptional regulator